MNRDRAGAIEPVLHRREWGAPLLRHLLKFRRRRQVRSRRRSTGHDAIEPAPDRGVVIELGEGGQPAKVGIDPRNQSLLAMGIQAGLSPTDWTAVAVSIGMSVAGVTMVVLAFLDPEPTSKLGLLVGGGALCVVTGGLTAVGILLRRRPPNIEVSPHGISIRWE